MVMMVEGGIWNASQFQLLVLDINCLYESNIRSSPHLSEGTVTLG